MIGLKFTQLKNAMVAILDDLKERDVFSIMTFFDEVHWWIEKGSANHNGTGEQIRLALNHILGLT